MVPPMTILILFLAALWAGAQNALAGGGSFVTFAVLLLTGVDARAANITSTIALFPGQLATGWAVRHNAAGAGPLSLRALVAISLAGGAIGGGRMLADWPGLSEGRLLDGRDLAPTLDLRSLAKGLLAAHLGLSTPALLQAFPGSDAIAPAAGLIRV